MKSEKCGEGRAGKGWVWKRGERVGKGRKKKEIKGRERKGRRGSATLVVMQ